MALLDTVSSLVSSTTSTSTVSRTVDLGWGGDPIGDPPCHDRKPKCHPKPKPCGCGDHDW